MVTGIVYSGGSYYRHLRGVLTEDLYRHLRGVLIEDLLLLFVKIPAQ